MNVIIQKQTGIISEFQKTFQHCNSKHLKKAGQTWDNVIEPRAGLSDIEPNAIEAFKKGAARSKRLPFVENENDINRIFENLLLIENGSL